MPNAVAGQLGEQRHFLVAEGFGLCGVDSESSEGVRVHHQRNRHDRGVSAEPTLTERDGAERDAALVTEAHYALGSRASAILIACVSRRLTTAPSGPAG